MSAETMENKTEIQLTLNGELQITCPFGFHVMDAAERKQMQFIEEGPGECFSDPERHLLISIAWKKSALSSLMLRTGEVAKSMERQTSKSLEPNGYRLETFVSRDINGMPAEGFQFDYVVDDIGMTGISLVLKRKKLFYFMHLYMRTALATESMPVLDEILSKIRWV